MTAATYHEFTPEALAKGGADRDAVESWFSLQDQDEPLDDRIDRLDGTTWNEGAIVDLGSATNTPTWNALRRIGRQVRRELKEMAA